jgi:hypothetical protein
VIALLVWRENGRGAALLFIGIFLLPMLAFALRNAQLDGQGSSAEHRTGRAAMNFVQGSWPEYHHAWQAQLSGDPVGIAITREINQETALLEQDPKAGIARIASRLATDPGYYSAWYLWRKPLLLWSWDIQVGAGGAYVLAVEHSPLETHPLLRWSSATLRLLNPLLSLLAMGGMIAVLAGGLQRRSWASAAALATGAITLYLTAIHTVFQAEPRYANAYRGIEILFLITSMKLLVDALRHWRNQRDPARVRRRT